MQNGDFSDDGKKRVLTIICDVKQRLVILSKFKIVQTDCVFNCGVGRELIVKDNCLWEDKV